MKTINKYTKLAGIAYLVIFITGFYSNFFVLENLIVPGDANATSTNIANNEMGFRFGIAGFILMVIADLIVAWALYIIFKEVNKNISLFTAWLRIVNVAIFGVALFHLFNILQLIGNSQGGVMIMLSLDGFNNTWLIGLIFFGIHLAGLGYLIFRSGFVPKFIGIFLIIAAIGYLIDSFAHVLLPNYDSYKSIFEMIVLIPGVVGELSFTVCLLFRRFNPSHSTLTD